jgi:hypothetical protein
LANGGVHDGGDVVPLVAGRRRCVTDLQEIGLRRTRRIAVEANLPGGSGVRASANCNISWLRAFVLA